MGGNLIKIGALHYRFTRNETLALGLAVMARIGSRGWTPAQILLLRELLEIGVSEDSSCSHA
jgi:hypothetical protein